MLAKIRNSTFFSFVDQIVKNIASFAKENELNIFWMNVSSRVVENKSMQYFISYFMVHRK